MIIKCPACGRRFSLERRPPVTFRCPKCSFTVPFSEILNERDNKEEKQTTLNNTLDGQINVRVNDNSANKTSVVDPNLTKVVDGLANRNNPTVVVHSLQATIKKGTFLITFQGHQYGRITLPLGDFKVGRNSSDSEARVKLTPDMSMSRIHAAMRSIKIDGQTVYQITSIKNENPVFINNNPIAKGKAYNLKDNDHVRMGDTYMVFRML